MDAAIAAITRATPTTHSDRKKLRRRSPAARVPWVDEPMMIPIPSTAIIQKYCCQGRGVQMTTKIKV